MKMRVCAVLMMLVVFCCGGEEFRTVFKEGQWQRTDWLLLKSPRWNYYGDWVQQADHIQNQVPAGVAGLELQRKYYAQSYTCMVMKKMIASDRVAVHSKMSFDYRMAPLIVLAGEHGKSADGRYPELREHWEVVLYDKGINVWHHEYKDGKPDWYLAASLQADFLPKTVYDLNVSVRRCRDKGHEIKITCGNEVLKYREFGLPDKFRAGITGCEGVNRFYDFGVKY